MTDQAVSLNDLLKRVLALDDVARAVLLGRLMAHYPANVWDELDAMDAESET